MWNQFIIDPMVNVLLWFYAWLGNNFFIAITIFTIVIKVITLPLNLRQQRASMRMQEMQPQIQAIQKKHRDNPQKMQEEFAKIGYNPAETLTGCLPLLIQMPILLGLFQVIRLVLGSTPQALFDLSQRVYDVGFISLASLLPISNRFLWMNLAQPDPYFVLPVLVLVTMYVSQKFLTPPPRQTDKNKPQQDDPAAAMTQSMQYTMPLMFGFFSLTFPSGLSIYFILSNILSVLQGWYVRRVMPNTQAATTVVNPIGTTELIESKSNSEDLTASSAEKQSSAKRKNRSAKR